MDIQFEDRSQAGKVLAGRLEAYRNNPDVIILALPRGGVPVGYEVAHALHVPPDVCVVRKLGVPGHEELAMGAAAPGNIRILNDEVVRDMHIPHAMIDAVAEQEQQEIARRERAYRDDRPTPALDGKIVLLVDDGLATGASMRAALRALRLYHPARIVVAVPTAAPSTCDELRAEADDVICAITPESFRAVGFWYKYFTQTTDDEVRTLLHRARAEQSSGRRDE